MSVACKTQMPLVRQIVASVEPKVAVAADLECCCADGESHLNTLRRYCEESGVDEQIDLRASQAVGIVADGQRTLRVWFNDGRIRDWDCRAMIAKGKGRIAQLADAEVFAKSATVWDGAPGFDLVGCHAEADSAEFVSFTAADNAQEYSAIS